MRVSDLLAFEAKMREQRGWKRKQFCEELGISQPKLRRHTDGDSDDEIPDKTLALACAAINADLKPYGDD